MRTPRILSLLATLLIGAVMAPATWAAPALSIAAASGSPGQTVNLPVTFTNDGTVVALQFDVQYNTAPLTLGTPTGAVAGLVNAPVLAAQRFVLKPSSGNAVLASGPLVTLPFTIKTSATAGVLPLTVSNVVMANTSAATVPPTLSNGQITVVILTASTTAFDAATGPNPAVVGRTVTLKAAVTGGTGALAPTGTVTFKDGTTPLGTATASYNATAGKAYATYTTTALSVGTHSLTAAYAGNAYNTASTSAAYSEVINAKLATTTTINSTSGPNPATAGTAVTIKANVSNGTTGATAFGPTGTVTFKDGTTTLGSGTLTYDPLAGAFASAAFTISTLAKGTHSITASYAGDGSDNTSVSTAWSLSIQ